MVKPVLFDFFCCGGGASKGYVDAGWEVKGFDIEHQAKYPYEFYQWDVLKLKPVWIRKHAQAVNASPPCKVHTTLKNFSGKQHTNLIPATRRLLWETELPFVIENVPGAPLINPVQLCGSSFGLYVRRHRLFEANWEIEPLLCRHLWQEKTSPGFNVKRYHDGYPLNYVSPVIGVFGGGQGYGPGETDLWRREMRIDWLGKKELSQAIPPPYTEYIGRQLMEQL